VVTITRVLYVVIDRRLSLFHAAASLSPEKEPPVYLIMPVKGEIFTYFGKRKPFIQPLSQAVIK
jgi:hypothetical protein